jgi:hypothetical protein
MFKLDCQQEARRRVEDFRRRVRIRNHTAVPNKSAAALIIKKTSITSLTIPPECSGRAGSPGYIGISAEAEDIRPLV